MSRTAGQFCLRSNMPVPPVLETAGTAQNNIPKTTSIESDTGAMTWQQQKDFGDLAVSEGGYPSSHALPSPDKSPLRERLACI
jgi:hypothetical protein